MTSDEYRRFIRSLLARRWVRFSLVTGLTALVYILLGALLVQLWSWPLLLGNAVAYVLSLLVAYFGQYRWTFQPVGRPHKDMALRFLWVQVGGLLLNSVLVSVMTWLLGLSYGLAMPLASILVPVSLYLLCRFWVFRPCEAPAAVETDPRFLPPVDAGQQLADTPLGDPPRVSVIMNCLNSADKLEESLRCLAAQTFTDFEVIFWDNGSTDQSPFIAQAYAPLLGRLRYFRGEETVSLGAARNLALREARGEYIAFLDCDDLWRPEKLAAQVEIFDAFPQVGLVCTDTEIFNGKRVLRRIFAHTRPVDGMAFAELMRRQWISMSSAMLRRSALESLAPMPTDGSAPPWFDESLNVCEEADLFYRIAHDWELAHVDAPLTLWRVHGMNTTFRKFSQFADETLRILEKHCRIYPDYEKEHADLVDLLSRRAAFQHAVALWREGKGKQARELLAPFGLKSFKHRLFYAASFLPGGCFDLAAKLYFALPSLLRR